MVTRPLVAAGVGLLVAAVAACGGGSSSSAAPATVTVTQPAAATPAATATPAAAGTSPAATGPAPSGRGDAGRTLGSLSAKGTVPTEQDGKKIQLTVGPVDVVTGSLADMKNFKLPATVKGLVPIYVTATFTHAGGPTVKSPYFMAAMFMENRAGEDAQGITLLGTFDRCESPEPATFAKGDSVKQCRIYLLPKGDRPGKLYGSWAGYGTDDHLGWKLG